MTTPDPRRAGHRSGKITRDAVLAAALQIIDRDGADAATGSPRIAGLLPGAEPPAVLAAHLHGGAAREPATLPRAA